jgi:hypothetical protein
MQNQDALGQGPEHDLEPAIRKLRNGLDQAEPPCLVGGQLGQSRSLGPILVRCAHFEVVLDRFHVDIDLQRARARRVEDVGHSKKDDGEAGQVMVHLEHSDLQLDHHLVAAD